MLRPAALACALLLSALAFAGSAAAVCRPIGPVGTFDVLQARVCALESETNEFPPYYTTTYDSLANLYVTWYDPENLYMTSSSDVSESTYHSCWDAGCDDIRLTGASSFTIACTQLGCGQFFAGANQFEGSGPGYAYRSTFVGAGAAWGSDNVIVGYSQGGFDGECSERVFVEGELLGYFDPVPAQPCTVEAPDIALPDL